MVAPTSVGKFRGEKSVPYAPCMVYLGKRPLWYVPVLPPLYRCTISINSMVFAVSHLKLSLIPSRHVGIIR